MTLSHQDQINLNVNIVCHLRVENYSSNKIPCLVNLTEIDFNVGSVIQKIQFVHCQYKSLFYEIHDRFKDYKKMLIDS